MGTKPHELLGVRRTSPASRAQDIAAAAVERFGVAKSLSFNPLLSARPSDASNGGRDKLLPVNEAKGRIDPVSIDLPMPSEERLRTLFDLTPAEARLAQRLACGDSVEEVAHILHIKMTTARTQLAAIFAKTETRRQAKLVAILSRIAHLEMAPAARPAATDSTEPVSPIAGARFAI